MHRLIQIALSEIRKKGVEGWIELAGLGGLFIFTFSIFNKSSIALRGIALMSLCFLVITRSSVKEWACDRIFRLSIIFLLFLAIRSIWRAVEFENYGPFHMDGTVTQLAGGFLLTLLVGYWLNRARGKWGWLMLALMSGFLVQIIRKMEWTGSFEMLYQFWNGSRRASFGSSAVLFGLWSSVVFLGCLLLDREFLRGPANRIRTWAWRAFWLTATLVSFAGLLFSQSRSSWLAAGAVIFPAIVWRQFKHRRGRYTLVYVMALILVLSSLFFTDFADLLADRIFSPVEPVRILLSDNDLPSSAAEPLNTIPIYERFKIYRLFWESWKQHPWIGYGPGSSAALFGASPIEFKDDYRDFHSLPFEILIQAGIIGIAILAGFLTIVFKQLRHSVRSGDIDRPYLQFALGGCVMILIYGFFSYPFSNIRGIYLFSFLYGMCYESKFSKTSARNEP